MSAVMFEKVTRRAPNALLTDEELLASLSQSLPYPWALICQLVAQLKATRVAFVEDQSGPPSKIARSQLRGLVANADMRAAVERTFGVRMAFRNRYRLALFAPTAVAEYDKFIGRRA